MRRVAVGLALAAMAGWFLWTKFQPPPARLKVALERAKREKRLVLLYFTGSDWCEWCMKMDDEALAQPEFIDYSAKYLVTLVADFPRTHELDADLLKANKKLYRKYSVDGFPTLVALKPDGKVVWRQAGYIPGGPPAVIALLNRVRLAEGLPEPAVVSGANSGAATKPAQIVPKEIAASPPPVVSAAPATSVPRGSPAKAPKLQGIVYSKTAPSVILDGKECEEGESVHGMRVVKILPNKVVVEWEGQTEELTMN